MLNKIVVLITASILLNCPPPRRYVEEKCREGFEVLNLLILVELNNEPDENKVRTLENELLLGVASYNSCK